MVYINSKANWKEPDGFITEKVCTETYDKATRWCKSKNEIYLKNTQPTEDCSKHTGALKKKIRK